MLRELLVGISLFVSNIIIHALGTFWLMLWLIRIVRDPRSLIFVRAVWILIRFLLALATLHFLEMVVWAEFYLSQHCFADRNTAYYFALVTYTTVGYGDVVLPHGWRLLGGLEATSGLLLFGWSTANLVSFLGRFREARERNPQA